MDEEDEEYTGVINSDLAHTDDFPFCTDMGCECHEDPGEVSNVAEYVVGGEMTTDEADFYYQGHTI